MTHRDAKPHIEQTWFRQEIGGRSVEFDQQEISFRNKTVDIQIDGRYFYMNDAIQD